MTHTSHCFCGCEPTGTMTPDQLKERIQDEIRRQTDDNEIAHGNEDLIHQTVLKEIAAGNPHATELAQIALTTLDIQYDRWYA